MKKILENFSLVSCIEVENDHSTEGHLEKMIMGEGSVIDHRFAFTARNLLNRAVSGFLGLKATSRESLAEEAEKLENHLKVFEEIVEGKFDPFPSPSDMMWLALNKYDGQKDMAAACSLVMATYTIVCIDRAITQLKSSPGYLAAEYVMFAAGGMNYAQFCASGKKRTQFASFASERGRRAAYEAHKETRMLKKEAYDYWLANIDKSLSNDEAATILKKQSSLKFRTLSKYVSEFKKMPT